MLRVRDIRDILPAFLRFQICLCCIASLILSSVDCVRHVRYVPDPEKDINQWLSNFSHQISFHYEYEAKLRFVRMEGTGYCVIGEGEKLSGTWFGEGSAQKFEYVGVGDIEYSRTDRDWERLSRGEESDIFAQITRILSTKKYSYQGQNQSYEYVFKANIPFLDPGRRKEMVGLITISPRNFLPDFVWAGLPDSSTYWTARLFDYNSKKTIKPPVKDKSEYLIIPVNEEAEDRSSLEKRLKLLSLDYRLEELGEGFLLKLPLHYGLDDAMTFLQPGGMVLYAVAEQQQESGRIAYLLGDARKPVYLTELLATDRDIKDVKISFDRSSALRMQLRLRGKRMLPYRVAIEVDSIVIGTAPLDTLKKSDRIDLYPEMQHNEIEILRAYILQPLGAYEVRASGGERR
ncbi:MAG: hypothetical protein JSV98_03965 [candidate division WOR-3 bacterium]|nr:MAG: hypothetical protein JSV98_03965 [candidate division WOR-3 bacterium]